MYAHNFVLLYTDLTIYFHFMIMAGVAYPYNVILATRITVATCAHGTTAIDENLDGISRRKTG